MKTSKQFGAAGEPLEASHIPENTFRSLHPMVSTHNTQLGAVTSDYMFEGRVMTLHPAGNEAAEVLENNAFVLVKLTHGVEQPLLAFAFPPDSDGPWRVIASPNGIDLENGTYAGGVRAMAPYAFSRVLEQSLRNNTGLGEWSGMERNKVHAALAANSAVVFSV